MRTTYLITVILSTIQKWYESNEDYLELKVEVSTYKVGKGNMRECSKEEARLIEENFQDVINLYETSLLSSAYYETCIERDLEE